MRAKAVAASSILPPNACTSPSGEPPLEKVAHDTQAAASDDEMPRFSCPLSAATAASVHKPLLVYIPGLDGTGFAGAPQMPKFANEFRVEALTLPRLNRWTIDELTRFVASHIEQRLLDDESVFGYKPVVYLLGESLGALLAISVAQECKPLVQRLVLVNPATSFDRSIWNRTAESLPDLPPSVYRTLPYVFAPLLGNPVRLSLRRVGGDDVNRIEQLEDLAQLIQVPYEALSLLLQMRFLDELLPPETVKHRIEYGRSAARVVKSRLNDIRMPTAIITGGNDLLLPSAEEGERLMRSIPDCKLYNLPESSHALMQEGNVDMCSILHRMRFLPPPEATAITAAAPPAASPDAITAHRNAPGQNGASLHLSVSNQPGFSLPSPSNIASTKNAVGTLRWMLSPRFFSKHEDGSVVHGVDAIRDERPMIFVGPHQLFALDLGIIIDEMLKEKNMLLRGLAHSAIFTGAVDQQRNNRSEQGNQAKEFFEAFGAVNVSGRSLFELMRKREAALLFPGGVKEAYKEQKDKYKLFWSDTPEFVRTAMRFGATIVPFGAVGLEDCFTILLEPQQQLALPGFRERAKRQVEQLPTVRDDELFVSPLGFPTSPRRLYISFGTPIRTAGMDYKDMDAATELYTHVREAVESEISWLLEQRQHDPYEDPWQRLPYETLWGRQAPTFPLPGSTGQTIHRL